MSKQILYILIVKAGTSIIWIFRIKVIIVEHHIARPFKWMIQSREKPSNFGHHHIDMQWKKKCSIFNPLFNKAISALRFSGKMDIVKFSKGGTCDFITTRNAPLVNETMAHGMRKGVLHGVNNRGLNTLDKTKLARAIMWIIFFET